MHPNPVFRNATSDENIAFARTRGFGVLTLNHDAGPLVSHIPYRLTDDGGAVELHLVRSNPILRTLEAPQPAVLAISGPHSYVSPDWYGLQDQVPTWNYVAVHLRGRLQTLEGDALPGILRRLSDQFEAQLPKNPWTLDKMDPDALARMKRMIVPCRLEIEDVAGTWKLGQNKTDAARHGAADGVENMGIGDGLDELAALMRVVDD